MKNPITVAVLGAGGRGVGFGALIKEFNHLGQVVAVAEPRDAYRAAFVAAHNLPPGQIFRTWEEFVARPKMCDAVVISTMDRDHMGPAVACLQRGYHVLLEKPMSTTLEDCRVIEAAQRKSRRILAVCHSLRYQKGFAKVKELIDSGRIGRLVTMDHLEQVAYWHQAHSYVRGNWGNEGRATFMLMAKSCHDIDYLAYLVGKPCHRVSSFGALTYFRSENAPPRQHRPLHRWLSGGNNLPVLGDQAVRAQRLGGLAGEGGQPHSHPGGTHGSHSDRSLWTLRFPRG